MPYLLFIISLLLHVQASAQSTRRPNIIFIMADDHAYQAIGAYGSQLLATPNIDRIAREGMRFDRAFVTNSICAPSRAVLLTGKYSHLNGQLDNRNEFDGAQITFPKLLQDAGYQTAIIGKWHLKSRPTGFDHWNILLGQGAYYNPTMVNMGDTLRYTGYSTEVLTELALDYLKGREEDQPFCLLFQHNAPHRNWMPNTKDLPAFLHQTYPLPATFFDDYQGRPAAAAQDMRIADLWLGFDLKMLAADYGRDTASGGQHSFDPDPGWAATLDRFTPEQRLAWDAHYEPVRRHFNEQRFTDRELAVWKYQRFMQDYLACVHGVDESIGRVLDYLDEHGLAENTIVVYTSDQGFYLGEHGWYDKRFMYEESLRTPLLMRYPGRIPAGSASSRLVLNLDFAPTILDYAGAAIPSAMQGLSLRPPAEAQAVSRWRDAIYYHYYEYPHGWHDVHKHYGVRTDHHKLIYFYEDDRWELYDLRQDPRELNNVVDQPAYRKVARRMKRLLADMRASVGDK